MSEPGRARNPIYPARRAIERAVATPGARPVRLFELLMPVWCVEISATVRETQPYEVFDGFLTRAVAEAHISDADELATFFGIQRSLVDRALRFLETIGHLHRAGDTVTLTSLGAQSVRDGCRYILKEERQKLYFDSFSSSPLPTSHYSGVTYVAESNLRGFNPLVSLEPFRHDSLAALLARPDRRDFNIPDGLRDATARTVRQVWLPAFLIQNAGTPPYLAYTMATQGRDHHIEALSAAIAPTLAAANPVDTRGIWRQWLDTEGFPDVTPWGLDNGVLRATLPASAFGAKARFRLHQLGSFETRRTSFLQLWCADTDLRRRAVLDRASQRLASRAIKRAEALRTQLDQFASQLDVEPPTQAELRTYAQQAADELALATLDELT
jgi:hypothetical protein